MAVTGENSDATGAAQECAVCRSGPCPVAFDLGDYRVLRCRDCGLHFVDVRYDERDIKDMEYYWAEDIYREEVAGIREWWAREMDKIEELALPGRLLDVGCSFGYLIEVANARGWRVDGVEISRKVYEKYIGDKAIALNVFNGRLEDAGYESKFFDVVTMFDLIEHLADPAGTLEEVARVIKSGGLLVLETPRQESLFKLAAHAVFRLTGGRVKFLIRGAYNKHPGGHRLGFTRKSILKLLAQKGFAPVRVEKRMMPLNMFMGNALNFRGSAAAKYAFAGACFALWVASAVLGMHNRMVIYAKKT